MHLRKSAPVLLSGIVALSLFNGACVATRKHVRNTVAPVETKVGEVQTQVNDVSKKTADNTTAIGDLDRNVARTDEKAMEADRKATAAGQSADRANQAATQAQSTANSATQLAQQTMAKAGAIEARMDNLDNYKLSNTEKVYFKVNRSELTDDEKAKLDQAVQSLQNQKNYIIEIAGFTDKTGNKATNLELSRRRAEAVVRYLTVQHNVPLRKIHDLGVGSEFPDAVNKTREDRKENRRVDVKVYVLDSPAGVQSSSTQTPSQE